MKLSKKARRAQKERERLTRYRFMPYWKYLKTGRWRKLRNLVLRRELWRCKFCGQRASQVHHLHYPPRGTETPDDLVALCGLCHEKEHGIVELVPGTRVAGPQRFETGYAWGDQPTTKRPTGDVTF